MAKSDVTVVVPAFNECQTIGDVVGALIQAGHQVVVVDDGSTDGTGDAAFAAGATVLRHPVNRGQGAALQTAFRYTVQRTTSPYVATFDADGQHAVEDIAGLVTELERYGADVALGSRFLGAAIDMPWPRRLLLKAAVLLTALMEGVRLSDAHNGLRVLTSTAVARLHLRHDRMAHASELIEQIRRLGLEYVEVPVTVRYTKYSRKKGQSGTSSLGILIEILVGKLS